MDGAEISKGVGGSRTPLGVAGSALLTYLWADIAAPSVGERTGRTAAASNPFERVFGENPPDFHACAAGEELSVTNGP